MRWRTVSCSAAMGGSHAEPTRVVSCCVGFGAVLQLRDVGYEFQQRMHLDWQKPFALSRAYFAFVVGSLGMLPSHLLRCTAFIPTPRRHITRTP